MADGYFTTGVPVVGNNLDNDLPEVSENFTFLKDAMMMLALFLIPGYYADYVYDVTYTDRVNTITIKNSGGTTQATCTLNYGNGADPYQVTSEVWGINGGKTYTYQYTYTGGKITQEKLYTMA